MDFFNTIIKFIQDGGWIMFPILFVFSVGLGIAFERWFKLGSVRKANRIVWEKLHPVLEEGDFEKARELIGDDTSTVARLLNMGLARQGSVRRRDDIEIAMEESMMEIIPQLEKRTVYIALFANISTLLGLLGTVIGLIEAFTAVAHANPAEKADMLTGSISVAMNATALGLVSGIILLVAHVMITTKTGEIIDSLEMASVKTLNIIAEYAKRQAVLAAKSG